MDFNKLLDLLIPIAFILFWAFGAFANKNRSKPGDEDASEGGPIFRPMMKEYEVRPVPVQPEAELGTLDDVKPKLQRATGPSIQVQLARQREEIRRKEKEAARLLKKAKQSNPYALSKKTSSSHSQGGLIRGLASKQALRQSVIAYEVLGTPVGLRKDDKLNLPWQR